MDDSSGQDLDYATPQRGHRLDNREFFSHKGRLERLGEGLGWLLRSALESNQNSAAHV
jgi:hypothetical protein